MAFLSFVETFERTARARPRPRLGLALGSGLARGWSHIGALRVLDAAGIRPDIVCGTSMGALVGGAWLAGELDALEAWALSLTRFRLSRLFDFRLGGAGLIGGRRFANLFPETMRSRRIETLPVPFAAVASTLNGGHEVLLREGNLVEALQASYAVPGFFPPVKIGGRWLVDGALVNPVPVSACRLLGADVVLALNASGDPYAHNSDPTIDAPAAPAEDPEPSMLSVLADALAVLQDRLCRTRLASDPPELLVTPPLASFGLIAFEDAREIIGVGAAAMSRALPRLRAILGSPGTQAASQKDQESPAA